MVSQRIDKNTLLRRFGQEEIMRRYVGTSDTKIHFSSPFRSDGIPSCKLKYADDGTLYFKDFGSYDKGDCFSMAAKVLGKTFLYQSIWDDMGGGNPSLLSVQSIPLPKKKSVASSLEISVGPIGWIGWGFDYWNKKYDISLGTLKLFEVNPLKWAIFKTSTYESALLGNEEDPLFSYKLDKGIYKTYKPFNKLDKWKNNYSASKDFVIEGENQRQRSDHLVIQKANKENMFIREHFKIDSVSSPSETALIPENKMEEYFRDYKKVTVMLDNDRAGREASNAYTEKYNGRIQQLFVRDHKNITDWYEKEKGPPLQWFKNRI